MITFHLTPKSGCEIYRDSELLEVVPVKGHVERLKALGSKLARKQGVACSMKRLRVAQVAR